MELTVRPITQAEAEAFRLKVARGFGVDPFDEEDASLLLRILDPARTRCAFDGDEIVGTCGAFSFELTVPGGTLPMAGTTLVTVQATHRRRGALRAMMREHLAEIRERGEPLAGLWASESSIYGRFGFGLAAEGYDLKLDGRAIEFTGEPPAGRIRLVEPGDARALLPGLHERVRPTRPGMLSRSDAWWETKLLYDPPHRRRPGRSAKRYAIHEGPGGPDGYAIYRQQEKWNDFPDGTVHVVEVMACGPEAHDALWRYLTRIDLFPNVQHWNLAVDDELPWRITEPRRVRRTVGDSLWIRVIDVPRALSGRLYAAEATLVLGVHDALLPDNDGAFELRAGPGGSECRRTDARPDLELDVDVLGALYLGGHRARTLARAGLVRGEAEALATADRLFGWDPLPWCPEVF